MDAAPSAGPRALTDAQVERALAWHREILAWKAARARVLSLRELALEMGVSRGAIYSAVKRNGQFKQVSPDAREQALQASRAKLRLFRKERRRKEGRAGARKVPWSWEPLPGRTRDESYRSGRALICKH